MSDRKPLICCQECGVILSHRPHLDTCSYGPHEARVGRYQPGYKAEIDAPPPAKGMSREQILDEAKRCVIHDRQSTYGGPEDSFAHTAALWSIHLGIEVTSTDVPILLALLKIARIKSSPGHPDNWVDMAGYAACGGEIATK